MDPSSHFVFGTHPQYGFVATATAHTPIHLADWYLTREQFERVPGTPGLYRLTHPEQDGARRTRQAVHDLRAQGFAVYADWLYQDHIGEQDIDEQAQETAAQYEDVALSVRDPLAAGTFDLVVYDRGALTLHALRKEVGDDTFFAILRQWVADHGGGSGSTDQASGPTHGMWTKCAMRASGRASRTRAGTRYRW